MSFLCFIFLCPIIYCYLSYLISTYSPEISNSITNRVWCHASLFNVIFPICPLFWRLSSSSMLIIFNYLLNLPVPIGTGIGSLSLEWTIYLDLPWYISLMYMGDHFVWSTSNWQLSYCILSYPYYQLSCDVVSLYTFYLLCTSSLGYLP